jgi:DNA-binding PadR family transcriptional regulator
MSPAAGRRAARGCARFFAPESWAGLSPAPVPIADRILTEAELKLNPVAVYLNGAGEYCERGMSQKGDTMTSGHRREGVLFQLDGAPAGLLGEGAPVDLPPVGGAPDVGDQRLPDVAYVVLGHVAASPSGIHGYELGRQLSRSGPELPPMRLGQLYRILRRLEAAALVVCHVESESLRLRYRFTVTPRGASVLQTWLMTLPRGTGAVCEQVLYRLRFAERLSAAALLGLVDTAAEESRLALERLGGNGRRSHDRGGAGGHPYDVALKERLAMDRCWLEEVRGLVERSAAGPTQAVPRSVPPARVRPGRRAAAPAVSLP